MAGIICEQCAAEISIPQGYEQPMIKCVSCGTLNKTGIEQEKQPTYKILGVGSKHGASSDFPAVGSEKKESLQDSAPATAINPENQTTQRPAPSVARAPLTSKSQSSQKSQVNIRKEDLPVATKRFMRDALGEQGLQMLFEMVAGYMSEFDEKKKKAKRARVLQSLMKSKITGTLASQALDFAERSPDTKAIMIQNCKHGIMTGLGVFFAGVIISAGIHFIANPGRGFVLFQVPFAVGLAYAVYSGVSFIELKNDKLRSSIAHNIVVLGSTLMILLYVIWGIFF